jgi:glycosyltransferase 2 family protein
MSFAGRTLRWQFMMRPEPSSFFRVLSATLVGFAMVVLIGRPGEFVRPYLIARQESSSIARQAAIWLLERLYDLLMILILFGLGLAYARRLDIPANSHLIPLLRVGGWIVSAGAAVAAAILYALSRHRVFCERRLGALAERLPHHIRERFQHSLKSFLAGTSAAGNWPSILGCVGLTFAEWLLILISVWCYFRAYPETSSFHLLDVAAFWGFVAVGAIVQLPGVGGGMQIASILVLTELFELPVEAATGLAVLIWAGSSFIAVPLGLPLVLQAGLNLKEIRQLGAENR